MSRRGFASRPQSVEAWVRAPEATTSPKDAYTARLTIDVTPVLRGRIKISAFERGLTVADMLRTLTEVELIHLEGKVERWVRFGREASERILDHRRRVLAFAPGHVFAFVRWAPNDYGTALSRIDIARAVGAGEPFSTVPCVTPGAEILLRLSGWPKVAQVLAAID